MRAGRAGDVEGDTGRASGAPPACLIARERMRDRRFHIGKTRFRHVERVHVAPQQSFPLRQVQFRIMEY
jgi:hypothetical protein